MSTQSTTEMVVRRTVSVALDPARAFHLFTRRMTEFWPSDHSIGEAAIAEVVIEPRTGGRWFERGVDGTECDWGHVARWDPPGRLVLEWQITAAWAFDPDLHTEVEVTFTEVAAGGTRVDLQHRHLERYGDQAESMHALFGSPGGWERSLTGFSTLAA